MKKIYFIFEKICCKVFIAIDIVARLIKIKSLNHDCYDFLTKVHDEAIDYHFSELGHDSTDWVPVELELVDKLWIPDAEILRLKGFT